MVPLRACPTQNVGAITCVRRSDPNSIGSSAARRRDPSDGRVSVIKATTAGERSAAALQEVRRNHLTRALAGWSAAELQQFDRLLTKFLADTKKTPINGS